MFGAFVVSGSGAGTFSTINVVAIGNPMTGRDLR
jgi:hypothetical protein